jgi:hypothetical protein
VSRDNDDQGKIERKDAKSSREELDAILSAREDLGAEYNDELADMLMERLDAEIDRRVEARLASTSGSKLSPAVAITSLIFAIPATGVAAETAGFMAVPFVWAGVVLINLIVSGKKIRDIF